MCNPSYERRKSKKTTDELNPIQKKKKITETSSELIRIERTMQISVISNFHRDCSFPGISIRPDSFVFLQKPLSQPVDTTILSET